MEHNAQEIRRQLLLALAHLARARKSPDFAAIIDAMELGYAKTVFLMRSESATREDYWRRRVNWALYRLRVFLKTQRS